MVEFDRGDGVSEVLFGSKWLLKIFEMIDVILWPCFHDVRFGYVFPTHSLSSQE